MGADRVTDHDLDPEVQADLRRRDAIERETSRRRELARVLPERDVDRWPCRTGCGAMVGITQAGIEQHELGNRLLESMGQRPAGQAEVMWCPGCRATEDRRLSDERAKALMPRQPELPGSTTTTNELARYLPTPRKGKRPLR